MNSSGIEKLNSIYKSSEIVCLGNATELTMGSSGEKRERGSHRPPLDDE